MKEDFSLKLCVNSVEYFHTNHWLDCLYFIILIEMRSRSNFNLKSLGVIFPLKRNWCIILYWDIILHHYSVIFSPVSLNLLKLLFYIFSYCEFNILKPLVRYFWCLKPQVFIGIFIITLNLVSSCKTYKVTVLSILYQWLDLYLEFLDFFSGSYCFPHIICDKCSIHFTCFF